ncbi:hypothetical protein HPP92_018626 [Vanilla planifolia]|uniref:Uncharacterized protein n=1 Tax=Vanilla planifolia TaxID=51239 RepID=A0A835UPP6_VANPL|nr:hypothetical protein HPP92_019217 [Vanilla planifolia]KAG0469298.1 hypothetical protein HPP92_018626 [Vanilla planifolia]
MFPHPHNLCYNIGICEISPPTFHQGGLHGPVLPVAATTKGTPPPPPPPAAKSAPPGGRRRPTRKDRHSKICTAQGPRDRRMRLSLEVARKFFDLQDLLGFDKASKTVQWLLDMSTTAIKELNAASEYEEDISTVSDNKGKSSVGKNAKKEVGSKESCERAKRTAPVIQPVVARESRDKARARARERVLEKKMLQYRGGFEDRSERVLAVQEIPYGGDTQDEFSCLELVAEMEEQCSTSPLNNEERGDVLDSIALFDYNQPWEMSFSSNIDERALLDELPFPTTTYGQH